MTRADPYQAESPSAAHRVGPNRPARRAARADPARGNPVIGAVTGERAHEAVAENAGSAGDAAAGSGPDPISGAGGRTDPTSELFRLFATRVYGYVRLRAAPDMADDVVADTFLTAWRLRKSIPDDPLPWLLVIARNALANRERSARRKVRLVVAMSAVERLARHADAAENIAVDRAAVLAELAGLSPEDREALLLVAWDGLGVADAATVAGCSERTFARRLRRTRSQLGLADVGAPAASTPTETLSAHDPSEDRP